MRIRAATRGSALARWQTDHVAALLRTVDPSVDVVVVEVDTEGDRRRDVPISSLGGKGVFAKEVQAAVLDGRAGHRRALGQGPAVDHRRRARARGGALAG